MARHDIEEFEEEMNCYYSRQKQIDQLLVFLSQECMPKPSELPKIPSTYHEMIQIKNSTTNDLHNLSTMDVTSMHDDELDEMQYKLEEKLEEVRQIKSQRYKQKVYCSMCQINVKNVVILGCNHLNFCRDCESRNKSKQCPRCLKPYTKIKIINR